MSKILDMNDICYIIPQRKRLLMVDRAEIVSPNEIIGLKNSTCNEPHFLGHFPDNPIMPGILQFEMMLQLANILYLNSRQTSIFLFPKKIDKIRFKRPVTPGDQIIANVSIEENGKDITVKSILKVNDRVCSQGTFSIGEFPKDYCKRTQLVAKNDFINSENITLNTSKIAEIIPHRYPFNFVDHIIEMSENKVVGKKLVSFNENNCLKTKNGIYHIPHSYIIESAAQVACTKILSEDENKNKIALFLSVESCTINQFAIPGDELIFHLRPLFLKKNLGRCIAKIYLGKDLLMDLEIAFGLVDKLVKQ